MTVNENKELLKIIENDIKIDFNTYEKSHPRPRKIFSTLALIGVLLSLIYSLAFFLFDGAFGNQDWKRDLATYVFPIMIVLFIFLEVYEKNKIFKYKSDFYATIDLAKYYRIQLSNLTVGELSELEIKNKNECVLFAMNSGIYLNLRDIEAFKNESKNNQFDDYLNFKLNGNNFTIGIVGGITQQKEFIRENFLFINLDNNQKFEKVELDFLENRTYKKNNSEKVDLEAPGFSNFVKVKSDDQLGARKILTPKVMDNLMSFENDDFRAKFTNLVIKENQVLGVIKNFRFQLEDHHSFKELDFKRIGDVTAGVIYNKITQESLEIFDLLRFLQNLELFENLG